MKRILGLDLGPNSIGWAVVEKDEADGTGTARGSIAGAGSRIIPMDAATQGDFDKGNSVSQTKERTQYRSQRRLRERHQLRRERLNRVLDVMGFLPTHYSDGLDRYGKFKDADGRKIAWREEPDGSRTFIFAGAYAEMLADFRREQPEWLAGGARVPYDWTIYYLRSKAVSRPIAKEELAWVVLNFNAKRGYYQLRGEDEDGHTQVSEEYLALKVVAVNDTGEHKGGNTWYDIVLDNGMACRRCLPRKPDITGQVRDFIVTTRLDKDGAPRLDAKGNVARSVRMPGEDDWQLLKKKTEADIDRAHTTVGQYVYSALLANPKQKVRGRLVRTIERKYYKDELRRILDKQAEFMPELRDARLYDACLRELYGSNEAYRRSVAGRGFTYLLADNIIFYQRPLKSKRSLIADCPYEYHTYTDKATGEERRAGVKCAAKSNPLYQEFRLWQFVSNLRLYEREKTVGGILRTDVDVTGELLPDDDARGAVRLAQRPGERHGATAAQRLHQVQQAARQGRCLPLPVELCRGQALPLQRDTRPDAEAAAQGRRARRIPHARRGDGPLAHTLFRRRQAGAESGARQLCRPPRAGRRLRRGVCQVPAVPEGIRGLLGESHKETAAAHAHGQPVERGRH